MTGTDPRQMKGGYQLDLFGAEPEPAAVAGPAPAPGSVALRSGPVLPLCADRPEEAER